MPIGEKAVTLLPSLSASSARDKGLPNLALVQNARYARGDLNAIAQDVTKLKILTRRAMHVLPKDMHAETKFRTPKNQQICRFELFCNKLANDLKVGSTKFEPKRSHF